jgi:hypothetical protein
VNPRPRYAQLQTISENFIPNDQKDSQVVFILVGDIVVFVSWRGDRLAIMQRTAREHGVHASSLVIWKREFSM